MAYPQYYLSKKNIMRKLIAILVLCPLLSQGQRKFGIKAGANFANVTNASSINSENSTGFMIGAFFAPESKTIMSSSTELIFSRQGYSYSTNTNTGKVNLNYILLEQMMGINITKFVKLQFGGMTGFLINAKADSSSTQGSTTSTFGMMDYMNRFDYGFATGIEIFPYKGLMIGTRLNLSMAKVFNAAENSSSPSIMPGIDAKSNVLQIYAGYRF